MAIREVDDYQERTSYLKSMCVITPVQAKHGKYYSNLCNRIGFEFEVGRFHLFNDCDERFLREIKSKIRGPRLRKEIDYYDKDPEERLKSYPWYYSESVFTNPSFLDDYVKEIRSRYDIDTQTYNDGSYTIELLEREKDMLVRIGASVYNAEIINDICKVIGHKRVELCVPITPDDLIIYGEYGVAQIDRQWRMINDPDIDYKDPSFLDIDEIPEIVFLDEEGKEIEIA